MSTRTMKDDLKTFSGEQLLWLVVMSNRATRVQVELELRRRSRANEAKRTLRLVGQLKAVA